MNINEQNKLSCIEIEPDIAATHSIIWLHGLGADGNDFVPIAHELQLPIRYIFPHAPILPVTINQGMEMRAWFDIYGFSLSDKIDTAGIARSVDHITQLIKGELARGVAPEKIILAGFSQGAMIALTTGLTYQQPLGGIIALSGFLPLADQVLKRASPANQKTPLYVAHGTYDPIVPYALGKSTAELLTQAGYPVTWQSYPIPHSVCPEEVRAIREWILRL